jgi:hypothetical protein
MGLSSNATLWAERLQKNTTRLGVRVRQAAIETTAQLGEALVDNSPVDTGRFRANWQHGVNVAPFGVLDVLDPSGAETKAKLRAHVMQADPGLHVFTNNLPYARRIEHGWSDQAPAGVVGVTVLQFGGRFVRSVAEAAQ